MADSVSGEHKGGAARPTAGTPKTLPLPAGTGSPAPAPFFDYDLPAEQIAQEPCAERDQSRLLVIRRAAGTMSHHHFTDLPELLEPGDLLVLNDTRVLPARLLGRRTRTGGKWEGLFLRQLPEGLWELLCQARGRLLPGETVAVEPGPLHLELVQPLGQGRWLVRPTEPGSAGELLQVHGQVPLPPYIRKGRATPADQEHYQTIYARQAGAVAAPTAGLHFTPRLFDRLHASGIAWVFVTLHIGPGTFQPVQTQDYTRHRMHSEYGEVSAATALAITRCRARGSRVVAVGTTSVRVLETAAVSGSVQPWTGETELYIYPPYRFRAVDALITNFHLPRSTLLLLVSALAGPELTRRAYETAIAQGYRFYSYGDAMLIV